MESTEPIIVFGSGHLESQIGRKLRARGHPVVEIAEQMRTRLDIHFAFSTSAVAAEQFVALLDSDPAAK